MGKRLITQRRGRGTSTYASPSHRYRGSIKHRHMDDKERTSMVKGKVVDIIHCPGHNAPLAKIKLETNETVLIAAPEKIKVNDEIASGFSAPAERGNTLPLRNIPDGSVVYNVESRPGDGGKFVRTSGAFARVVSHVGDTATIILPSKKQKVLDNRCRATLGVIAGGGRKEKPFLKAGKKMAAMRARNKLYPRTSGVAMNAVDHPFGSGRGRHVGKSKTPPRNAPPGRNVGQLKARRTGKKK